VAPAGVDVRKVDLSVELQVLAFLGQQRVVSALNDSAVNDSALNDSALDDSDLNDSALGEPA
jgi:hypothetical protein